MDQTKKTVCIGWWEGQKTAVSVSKSSCTSNGIFIVHIFFVKTYSLVLKEKETFVKEALYKFSYALTLQSWFCCCRDGRRW